MNTERATQYLKQALGYHAELAGHIETASGGAPDWSALSAAHSAVRRNLESALADLAPPAQNEPQEAQERRKGKSKG